MVTQQLDELKAILEEDARLKRMKIEYGLDHELLKKPLEKVEAQDGT